MMYLMDLAVWKAYSMFYSPAQSTVGLLLFFNVTEVITLQH